MPDYTYHESQQCRAKTTWSGRVPASNGGEYHVYVALTGAGHCTCPGFHFRGRCKHTLAARAEHVCDWDLEHGAPQSFQDNVNMRCPVCGGDTELVRVAA